MKDVVLFRCINDKGKLRIRIVSYIDHDGKIHVGVYNNNYNCRFPKAFGFRTENQMYQAPASAVALVQKDGQKTFYNVKPKEVTHYVPTVDELHIKLYKGLDECVVCMDEKPQLAYVPCGHVCCCKDCSSVLADKKCPLCRANVLQSIEM